MRTYFQDATPLIIRQWVKYFGTVPCDIDYFIIETALNDSLYQPDTSGLLLLTYTALTVGGFLRFLTPI